MGNIDIKRQAPNVLKMKLFVTKVVGVDTGSKTLKDAINKAILDYAENYESTNYCLGSAFRPHSYPEMVRFFQSVIGEETKKQSLQIFGKNSDVIIPCVGDDSNAMEFFRLLLKIKK